MHCITTAVIKFNKNLNFVLIQIFGYPEMFTEKSCQMCPDK